MALALVEEDGTGLSSANVYDLPPAAVTFLTDRGYPVFDAGDSTEQDRWLLDATEIMEREMQPRVHGAPLNLDDQAMLWPRVSAVNRRLQRFDTDERPAAHREGIFFLAEDVAVADGKGSRVLEDDPISAIKTGRVGSMNVEFRRPVTFEEQHSAAFRRASEAYPDGIRAARA